MTPYLAVLMVGHAEFSLYLQIVTSTARARFAAEELKIIDKASLWRPSTVKLMLGLHEIVGHSNCRWCWPVCSAPWVHVEGS